MEIKKYDSPSNDGTIYEFTEDGNLVGGAKVEIKDKCLYLKSLYVEPAHRRRKYGSYILKYKEDDNANSISRIESLLLLFSEVGYENLIEFYEKNGYEYNIIKMEKTIK